MLTHDGLRCSYFSYTGSQYVFFLRKGFIYIRTFCNCLVSCFLVNNLASLVKRVLLIRVTIVSLVSLTCNERLLLKHRLAVWFSV